MSVSSALLAPLLARGDSGTTAPAGASAAADTTAAATAAPTEAGETTAMDTSDCTLHLNLARHTAGY